MASAAAKQPIDPQARAQEQILDIIVGQDDVSWKQLIFGLIETEQMDPWDINISLLSQRFLDELKKLKEMDFRVSGKVVLASAILLKLKAEKLHDEEIGALDSLIQSVEQPMDMDLGMMELAPLDSERPTMPKLTPRTPQPRERKVSIYDLVEALEEALETEARRPPVMQARVLDTIEPPKNHIDISKIIQEVYGKVYDHYETQKNPSGSMQFTHLTTSDDPRTKVLAFIPLLHLENAAKVEMEQPEHFGDITIHLKDATPPAMNLGAADVQTANVVVAAAKKPAAKTKKKK